MLASHDALAAAGEPGGAERSIVPAGLSDEIKYVAPLTLAGFVLLSGGPIAVAAAALVGAGLGGAALKELFDDYTAPRHSENFQAALAAGAALLWVRCDDPDRELAATRILEEAGGHHVHIHGRPLPYRRRAAADPPRRSSIETPRQRRLGLADDPIEDDRRRARPHGSGRCLADEHDRGIDIVRLLPQRHSAGSPARPAAANAASWPCQVSLKRLRNARPVYSGGPIAAAHDVENAGAQGVVAAAGKMRAFPAAGASNSSAA